MRAVNLIPLEERRGETPGRTAGLAYAIVGLLAVAVAMVTMVVLTSNQIADREADIERLEAEDAAAAARLERLAGYTQFAAFRQQRVATVTSLAESRFDWERVMRELSLVLPSDVWLIGLAGTVRPDVSLEDAPDIALRDGAMGPALEMIGCAASQDAVAGFVSALRDIDGVTRVGVARSERPDATSETPTGAEASSDDCRTRDFITQFEIVASFDAAPVPLPPVSAEGAVPVTTESAPSDTPPEG